MSKSTLGFLITAGVLIVASAVIFIVVMSLNGWNFKSLSTSSYKTSTYEITEDFDGIVTTTRTADVAFLPSWDDKCTVVCYERESVIHEVKVDGNKLVIDVKDNRRWYEYIDLSFEAPKITVYLPTDMLTSLNVNGSTGNVEVADGFTFEDISISVSTGSISVSDVKAGTIDCKTSTGGIKIKRVTCSGNIYANVGTGKLTINDTQCNGIYSEGRTGDVKLTDTIATDAFGIQRSTGDIELERCDAESITIKTSTGDIEGTLLSAKAFFTHTSTGDIDVPRGTTGGTCTLTTTTGDIEIKVKK
ncbi:MAG: DUF4097 family beta strand repeat protein [Clostridia bacterium]|nr:DUF4097 family beta strand repeat protein [Clostridia bacterium]